jgi:hypothetical protein
MMLLENITWALAHGEVNDNYFFYGLDRLGGPRPADFLSQRQEMGLIARQIKLCGAHEVVRLLKDKLAFGDFAARYGFPVASNLAILDWDTAKECLPPRRTMPLEQFLSEASNLDGFAKPARGEHGRDMFRLQIRGGRLRINGEPGTLAELVSRLREPFLLQEPLDQHDRLARLHAPSINTLRITTVLQDGRVTPLAALLRIGTNDSMVDNLTSGGLAVRLDLARGTLHGNGHYLPGHGTTCSRHPTSGVLLDGYEIPMVGEAIDIAARFHKALNPLFTVGWDIAITPNGPCVVEGNSHWRGRAYMALEPGYVSRYLALMEKLVNETEHR